jgi:hypothetical protein
MINNSLYYIHIGRKHIKENANKLRFYSIILNLQGNF